MLQSTTGAGSGSAAAAHQCHVLLRCQAVIFNLCDQQANNMAQITRKCNKRRLCCSFGRGDRTGTRSIRTLDEWLLQHSVSGNNLPIICTTQPPSSFMWKVKNDEVNEKQQTVTELRSRAAGILWMQQRVFPRPSGKWSWRSGKKLHNKYNARPRTKWVSSAECKLRFSA